jgi:hypothetical protein
MLIHQVVQISESHCGPAVIEMLLDAIGIKWTQAEITRAAGVEDTIEEYGTRIDQLAKAVGVLAPQAQFWYKYYSSLDDIKYLLNRGYGVGVEWQGLFYDSEEEEAAQNVDDSESGHYAVVSHIDEELEAMVIVDPYKDFAEQSRIFSLDTFVRRWWDRNELHDPFTGKTQVLEDVRLLFFITPIAEEFPPERRFKRFSGM